MYGFKWLWKNYDYKLFLNTLVQWSIKRGRVNPERLSASEGLILLFQLVMRILFNIQSTRKSLIYEDVRQQYRLVKVIDLSSTDARTVTFFSLLHFSHVTHCLMFERYLTLIVLMWRIG